jgi:hypothetical protein
MSNWWDRNTAGKIGLSFQNERCEGSHRLMGGWGSGSRARELYVVWEEGDLVNLTISCPHRRAGATWIVTVGRVQ